MVALSLTIPDWFLYAVVAGFFGAVCFAAIWFGFMIWSTRG